MQCRVIVVTDPHTHKTNKQTHKQTNTQTHKQTGPITIHCAAKLARSINSKIKKKKLQSLQQRVKDDYTHKYHTTKTAKINEQEAQPMLTTGSTRIAVSRGQQTCSIPRVTYSFLLCNSNFDFKTRRFYDIRLQKIS